MITYVYTPEHLSVNQLHEFFHGWSNPPSRETQLRLLKNSDEVVLAIDGSSDMVVGFVTAITDHVLSAYIPFVEVAADYQGHGIGKELVNLMLARLNDLYMIDLLCDEGQQSFYKKLGMNHATGMMIRNTNINLERENPMRNVLSNESLHLPWAER